MRLLVAEDDLDCRQLLAATLGRWGYEVVVARDGAQVRGLLAGGDRPPLAIVALATLGADGVALLRRIRGGPDPASLYVIALAPRDRSADIATALQAGADDYLATPLRREELQARVRVGVRTLDLQRSLAERTRQLDEAWYGIDAPIRSLGDDARLLAAGFASLQAVLARYRAFRAAVAGCVDTVLVREVRAAERAADLVSLEEAIPGAIDRTLDAAQRVATVLRAMTVGGPPGLVDERADRARGSALDDAPMDAVELWKDVPAAAAAAGATPRR